MKGPVLFLVSRRDLEHDNRLDTCAGDCVPTQTKRGQYLNWSCRSGCRIRVFQRKSGVFLPLVFELPLEHPL